MHYIKILFLVWILFSSPGLSGQENENFCLSPEEKSLHSLINQYRAKEGLKEIPLSASLSKVAQAHALDLSQNKPYDDVCNPHSWSEEGNWTPCCYTSDHAKAECMWNKPSEITGYPGQGFEIVAMETNLMDPTVNIHPQKALNLWIESNSHRSVIVNQKSFKDVDWKALGIGIHRGFACVWFGMLEDTAPPLPICDN